MGGGAAMRAAAKVAGVGVITSGFRGVPAVSPAEHPITSAARKATRPVSAIFASTDATDTNIGAASSVQRPSWELDDWEFAGGEEEPIKDIEEPLPRLVFGGSPTLEEAKEATSELKDALDKSFFFKCKHQVGCNNPVWLIFYCVLHGFFRAYLSPSATGCSFITHPEPSMVVFSDPNHLETKACVTGETREAASVPKNAIQAFKLLNESAAAQNVVASIASDPDVWNAVLKNEALVGFLESQKITTSLPKDMDASVKEFATGDEFQNVQSPKCFNNESINSDEYVPQNGFGDFIQNIKVAMADMMSSVSGYFRNLFGGPELVEGSGETTIAEKALGATFMGLAVMVIMWVVLKRH